VLVKVTQKLHTRTKKPHKHKGFGSQRDKKQPNKKTIGKPCKSRFLQGFSLFLGEIKNR
jgi:hypothetical protein